jgi:dihydrofolate reductase
VYSLKEAFDVAEKHFELMQTPEEERTVFVIGGGETYRNALPQADLLYITHVHTTVEDADTYFPIIDPRIWEKVSSTPAATDPESGLTYEFAVYKRAHLWKEKNSDPGSR